jgi:hypothetical protein
MADRLDAIPIEDLDDGRVQVARPAGASSFVWEHFAVLLPAQTHVVCLHCGHQKEDTKNTSNMLKHLREIHKLRDISKVAVRRGDRSAQQLTLHEARLRPLTAVQKERIDTAMALFIGGDARPPSLIKGKWFLNLLSVRIA